MSLSPYPGPLATRRAALLGAVAFGLTGIGAPMPSRSENKTGRVGWLGWVGGAGADASTAPLAGLRAGLRAHAGSRPNLVSLSAAAKAASPERDPELVGQSVDVIVAQGR